LSQKDRSYGYVLDSQRRFLGLVSTESLAQAIEESTSKETSLDKAYIKDVKAVNMNDSMQDILPEVASRNWPVPVVNDDNVYKGVVSKYSFLKTLHRADQAVA
jgi:glycine betaine/proline transport system ATP-binding protein